MTQESSTSPWTGKYLKFQLTAWAFFLVVDLFMLAAYANATGPKALKMLTGIVITALASHVILTAAPPPARACSNVRARSTSEKGWRTPATSW